MKNTKHVKKILLTLTPSLILLLSLYIMEMALYSFDDFNTFMVAAHIMSLLLLVAWVKYNFESLVFLAVGFAIPSLFMLVFEFFAGGWLQYLVTLILAITYSLPFIIFTASIIIIRKKAKNQELASLLTKGVLVLAVPCLILLNIILGF